MSKLSARIRQGTTAALEIRLFDEAVQDKTVYVTIDQDDVQITKSSYNDNPEIVMEPVYDEPEEGSEDEPVQIGNGMFAKNNRSALFGAQHICHTQSSFMAGELHDSLYGKKGVAAIGVASIIGANTAFAIGNGTSNTARSNIFEITDDQGATGVVMKSPGGSKYKLTVDDSGNLSTTLVT